MERQVHEFYLMEYAALRTQLMQQYQTTFNWLIYIITADAVIVSWITNVSATKGTLGEIYYMAAALPLIISVFGHIILAVSYRSIESAIIYLKTIDRKYGDDVGFGQFYDGLKVHARLPSTRAVLLGVACVIDALAALFLVIVIFSQIG